MRSSIPYFAVAAVLCYALYNAYKTKASHTASLPRSVEKPQPPSHPMFKDTQSYIVDVIDHGSSRLRFKPEEIMEGGFASPEDAPKIACYVRTLANEKCDFPSDAPMYYSSNCAGCHGDDGKGLGGTYPDLTKHPLLGMRPLPKE